MIRSNILAESPTKITRSSACEKGNIRSPNYIMLLNELAFVSAMPDRLSYTAGRVTLSLSLAENAFYTGAKLQGRNFE